MVEEALRPELSVVVPVRDEAPALEELIARLVRTLDGTPYRYELWFVDDGSRDHSAQLLARLAAQYPQLGVVTLRRPFGKAAALAAGFERARAPVLATLDGDLQDRPEELPRLLEVLAREGADLVIGRKRVRRDRWTRRLASWAFNRVLGWLSGAPVRDANSGLKVLRAEVAAEVVLRGTLDRFLAALAAARGFRIAECAVEHAPRRYGRSRFGWRRYGEAAFDLVTVLLLTRFGERPLHFFGLFGALLAAGGGAILTYLALLWCLGHGIGTRPLLSYGVALTVLGVQCLFFGLLAEMLVWLHDERRPGYGVRAVSPPRGGATPQKRATTSAKTSSPQRNEASGSRSS